MKKKKEIEFNKDNYEKAIIGILQILCQLNSIIINSFSESFYFQKNSNNIDFDINVYQKINTFEYQYTMKKVKSNKNIFQAFNNNIDFYFDEVNNIYNIIKEDIKNKYKEYKDKKHSVYNKIKKFGIIHLHEWKFILSVLKLYIYSFYSIEYFSYDNNYFIDEELFKIMVTYYFDYPDNSIYQNIFLEIIKLICNERCPEKIVLPFLKSKSQKQNSLIYKIIKNIKEDIKSKNDKYKNLNGINIEILKLFSSSFNPYILNSIENLKIDSMIKDLYNKFISPKYERKLNDYYDYSDSEIFNSDNDKNDTFDGNDEGLKRKYESFEKIIQKFIEKYKKRKKQIDNKSNINEKYIIKKYEIEEISITIKEKREIKYEKEEKHFSIERKSEFECEEKKHSSDSSSDE